MHDVVIVGYARTPIGKFQGGLTPLSAMDLGGRAIAGALDHAGISPDLIDQVYMGHVLQAGQGQMTARQAATRGGIGMDVPALTLNKVCPSGMAAIGLARQTLMLGEADVIVAGGMESMSNAPYLLPTARAGMRMGNGVVVDSMIHDGLWCSFDNGHMGEGSDIKNTEYGISREAQDEWSAMSHERAVAAWKAGRFDGEVVAVEVPQRKGDPVMIEQDEGMRPGTTAASLSGLRPAFTKEGTITAGNASQVSDGGAAVVLTTQELAAELGLTPLARLLSYGVVAGPDPSLHHQPAEAIRVAAAKIDADPSGFDLYEMNEAFASVAIHSAGLLEVGTDKINVNGGAVALGHPIGCTGARITVSLLNELRNRGGGTGAASLCGGGGQGDALILQAL
ncbi:MAG: acetyl-CoA C-acetyltransferase [Euzebya sp.]